LLEIVFIIKPSYITIGSKYNNTDNI